MRPFDGRRVLLGVTGGIASYKSVWLARLLTQAGAEVDVVMTRSATEFVGPVTFEAVTGRPVLTHLLAPGHALDHIRLPRSAQAIVVAPATADFIARAAHGEAGDLLTAALLAAGPPRGLMDAPAGAMPVMIVPAMNDRMWAHPATARNAARLRELGYDVLEPESGPLASPSEGSGAGRMPEPETIMAHVGRMLEAPRLAGRTVLVTAGPTREAVDPVRFLSNHSSGKMGLAIAAAAWRRGARVQLVLGPADEPVPTGPLVTRIESTEEMADAVRALLPDADALVMAAAPADFRAATPERRKMKKGAGLFPLELAPTTDILAGTRDARRRDAVVVGFALETHDAVANGRAKLAAKGLDMVVLNVATEPGAGFGVDTNRVTFLTASGEEPLPLLSKAEVADAILDRVEARLRGR
jgi:phosphopantothenoylcysteine decarboxylase / phosphopantothenate---cysteine ligase